MKVLYNSLHGGDSREEERPRRCGQTESAVHPEPRGTETSGGAPPPHLRADGGAQWRPPCPGGWGPEGVRRGLLSGTVGCSLTHSLCCLPAGLHASVDSEEWEIVFPALWSRGQQAPAGGSGGGGGGSAEPGCGNRSSAPSAPAAPSPATGSSREVRSVSSSVEGPAQAAGEAAEEEDAEDEYESQEFYHWTPLPQGSGATPQLPATLSPPPPPLAEDGDEVLLRIPAFARELYLLLKRDSRFLAPGFAVEERLGGDSRSQQGTAQGQPERACYYSGAVLRYPGSFASFSTCGGLVR